MITLEPRNVFDLGIIGAEDSSNRLVYSLSMLLDALMTEWNLDEDSALEWLIYNTLGTSIEGYPIIINDLDGDDYANDLVSDAMA